MPKCRYVIIIIIIIIICSDAGADETSPACTAHPPTVWRCRTAGINLVKTHLSTEAEPTTFQLKVYICSTN